MIVSMNPFGSLSVLYSTLGCWLGSQRLLCKTSNLCFSLFLINWLSHKLSCMWGLDVKLFQFGPSQTCSHNGFICYSGGWEGVAAEGSKSYPGDGHGEFCTLPSWKEACTLVFYNQASPVCSEPDSKCLSFFDLMPKAWKVSWIYKASGLKLPQPAADLRLWP